MNPNRKLQEESVEEIDVKTVMDVEEMKTAKNVSIARTRKETEDLEY